MRTQQRAYVLLILSMISWGFSNPFSDIAMEHFLPTHMLLVEVGAGALVLTAIALLRRRPLKFSWKWALILGALEPGLTYFFGNVGYASGTVVTGLIIMSSEVLMLALLGRLILQEKIKRIEAAAIALGFTGAVLVGWAASQAGLGDIWSGLAFAMAALCAAGYAIAVRFFTLKNPTTDIFAITWGQTLVAVALGCIALPFTTNFADTSAVLVALPTEAWLAAIGAGVFGVAIPFLLFAEAARHVPARHAAISLNIIPVVGITFGAFLGRGLPTALQYAGGVLVLISLFALTLVADEEKISH
ncbi:MAG: hypothetical protein RIS75_235 [Actinomycetota bacterium]